jgi:integrase/recombinase XerD
MREFTDYLNQLGFSHSTLKQHFKLVQIFNNWLVEKSLEPMETSYKNLVWFMDDAMKYFYYRRNPRTSMNRMLVALSYYFDYFISLNPEFSNPAKNIRLKNQTERIVHDLLDIKELNMLYSSIEPKDPRSIRNKVIFGFLVFQGLSSRELHRLKLDDLKLRKGTIFISGDKASTWKKGSTSREIRLEALQIIDLLEYVDNIRPRILAGTYRQLPGRKPASENIIYKTDQLLMSISGSLELKNSLIHLFKNLKDKNPKVKNAMQIRQSVISIWLQKYNLRTVQYMAGHRFVSSTEYYKQINMEELRRKVCEFHPLV